MGLNARKPQCLWVFANNKGTNQPVHPRSLISAFVIQLLQIILSKLALRNFIILASLCSWGDWFESRFVGNLKDRFCFDKAHIIMVINRQCILAGWSVHMLFAKKKNTIFSWHYAFKMLCLDSLEWSVHLIVELYHKGTVLQKAILGKWPPLLNCLYPDF